MMVTASSANDWTAVSSIRCPATMSFVMPVSAVTSGGIGFGRLIERGKDIPNTSNATVRQVIELDHPELDHLVFLLIKARRLDVEEGSGLRDQTDGLD
jgi:hypothetical protein